MNKYLIKTSINSLDWYAESALLARKEAEDAGHKVASVHLVKSGVPPLAPGVVCKCNEDVETCPAHGKKGRR